MAVTIPPVGSDSSKQLGSASESEAPRKALSTPPVPTVAPVDGGSDEKLSMPKVVRRYVEPPPYGAPGLKHPDESVARQERRLQWTAEVRGAWKDAVGRVATTPVEVELSGVKLRAVPNEEVTPVAGTLPSQQAFTQRMREEGKDTLWVQVNGRLEGPEAPGFRRGGDFIGWAKGRPVTYSLQVPLVYDPNGAPRRETADALVRVLQRPPLSREALASMSPGSALILDGAGFIGTEGRDFDGSKPEKPEFKFTSRIYRHEGSSIEVEVDHRRSRFKPIPSSAAILRERAVSSLLGSVKASSSAGVDLDVEIGLGINRRSTYHVDLAKDGAAKAHSALMVLDLATADAPNAAVVRHGSGPWDDTSYSIELAPPSDVIQKFMGQSGSGLGANAWVRQLKLTDPRIQEPLRVAETKRLTVPGGAPIRWLETGGLIEPRVSLLAGPGQGLPANVQAGVQGGMLLRYNILSAHSGRKLDPAKDSLRRLVDVSIKDPTRLGDPEVPRGTEIAFQRLLAGRGLVRYSGGYNHEFPMGFQVAAFLGLEASSEALLDTTAVMTKLDDHRVMVGLRSAVQDTTTGAGGDSGLPLPQVRGAIGVTPDAIQLTRNYDENSALAGYFEKPFGSKLADVVNSGLESLLNVTLESGGHTTNRREHSQQLVFDLRLEEDRQLLRQMTRVFPGKANDEERRAYAEALQRHRMVAYAETSHESGSKSDLKILGKHFGGSKASTTRAGEVRTAAGKFAFDAEEARRTESLFGGETNALWEAYRSNSSILGTTDAWRVHLNLHRVDPMTSSEDIQEFLTVLRIADAKLSTAKPKVEATKWYRQLLSLSRYGKTTHDLDLTVDRKGIDRALLLGADDWQRMFVSVSSMFDTRAGDAPWLPEQQAEGLGSNVRLASGRPWRPEERSKARELCEDWLKTATSPLPSDERTTQELAWLDSEYRKRFGRDMKTDALHFNHARLFASARDQLSAALQKPNGDAEALKVVRGLMENVWETDSREERNTFFWRYLGTLILMAGTENVVLTRAAMTSEHGNVLIEAVSGPAVQRAQDFPATQFGVNTVPPAEEATVPKLPSKK